MTIYYDKLEDQYWIASEDGPLFFDSSLEAEDALREMEIRQAINDEVALIVAFAAQWMGDIEYAHFKHAVEAGEYKEKTNA